MVVDRSKRHSPGPESLSSGLFASALGVAVNSLLAIVKTTVGLVGHSQALVADGIESTADVASSLIVWGGLRVSARPPDRTHPYGHGKAESMAALLVALGLILAAILIAVQSIREILHPDRTPAWYTLVALVAVIAVKEGLFRYVIRVGDELDSNALRGDAWHHRSDALTSMAALIGIGIALIGGEGFETADDWAALVACVVILFNGLRILRPAVDEVMDAAAPSEVEKEVRAIGHGVDGVVDVEKCRIRKAGVGLLMDIHITVGAEITVRHGHDIAHAVQDALVASDLPIRDVTVHVEPDDLI